MLGEFRAVSCPQSPSFVPIVTKQFTQPQK
jgi:hypothetical protein